MGKKLAVLLGSFVIGFVISFFYVNLQYQQASTNQPSLPSDHPPVNENRESESASKGSKTGPLAALGGSADSDEKDEKSPDKEDNDKDSKETKTPEGDSQSSPAATVYKNLQILKDIPSSEVLKVMQSFTEGLGVNCTYCHVSVEDLAKDGKEEKETAREMLRMVREINKKYPTEGSVTCYTCHRGAIKPAS
jgi:Photosynthetic reaction centre cytochrome C subunit